MSIVCEVKREICDLVITPHKQTIGYNRSKRQTRKKTIIAKQKQIIKKRFSKRRNAALKSDTKTIEELQYLKNTINKNNSIEN